MKPTTWVILGATSIIAEEFAHLAGQHGHPLLLIGRDKAELEIIAADLQLRHQVDCEIIIFDFTNDMNSLIKCLQEKEEELALFIAYSDFTDNQALTFASIKTLITINISSIVQLVHGYLQKFQSQHRLIFLSSVAACRGRSKNSLYGASKAAVEVYLQGLQQTPEKNRQITIARLGFIDTAQTFGLPGIFYASPPKKCAEACWKATYAGKPLIYHPHFWRAIMAIITRLPFFIYRKLKF
ncbi:oxidoreductase [Legionella beliardensis]|uniref:Oxidoreductase n=1 Tax=Legionella beliardensis TaxID=91822 RepID=A0A378I3B9_9GAMM|nr:SDR family NAD(P)-dependent oxidoreductase [Legionella beliardensis]STX29493.1 oxidoreductase [Legionella beliardensis]